MRDIKVIKQENLIQVRNFNYSLTVKNRICMKRVETYSILIRNFSQFLFT